MKTPGLWIASVVLLLGCEVPELPETTSEAQPPATTPEPNNAASQPTDSSTDSTPQPFTADSPQAGRRSAAAGGYLASVGHSRFWAEHQLILDSIKHALDLYNATNGRYPESHDEFMEQIIEFNRIQLPELPPGEEYIYDPDEHELMTRPVEGAAADAAAADK